MIKRVMLLVVLGALGAPLGCAPGPTMHAEGTPPWTAAEAGRLSGHVQLTFPDRFLKAGESYFSPDERMIIFQAIEVPPPGAEPEEHYQMYVADLARRGGRITGITNLRRLSPPGTSNTCGWFHPTQPGHVIFGSTIVPPTDDGMAGYQRGTGRYLWQFPKEMTIVECDLARADGTAATLTPLVQDDTAYLAECTLSPDGRKLVYCRRVVAEGNRGGDLIVRDLDTGREVVVAGHDGYDGGPFFSPEGRRLCYRSDRRGNDLLQVFVGDLAMDASGRVTGLAAEHQLTDDDNVNWAPFWHPDGRHIIYTTSALGHRNYEVFLFDADAETGRYGTNVRRVTEAAGFDGLPAFNADGSLMMWTSQRGAGGSSQIWVADFDLLPPAR